MAVAHSPTGRVKSFAVAVGPQCGLDAADGRPRWASVTRWWPPSLRYRGAGTERRLAGHQWRRWPRAYPLSLAATRWMVPWRHANRKALPPSAILGKQPLSACACRFTSRSLRRLPRRADWSANPNTCAPGGTRHEPRGGSDHTAPGCRAAATRGHGTKQPLKPQRGFIAWKLVRPEIQPRRGWEFSRLCSPRVGAARQPWAMRF